MSAVVIAPMRATDLSEVLAIERASFPRPWEEATFRDEMTRPWARCRVARVDGALVGNLVYWLAAGEIELLNVATHPAHRGRGVGRALVAHLLDEGREAGASRVHLEVRRSNVSAIALYERMGFAHRGVRAAYYADNLEDALLMENVIAHA